MEQSAMARCELYSSQTFKNVSWGRDYGDEAMAAWKTWVSENISVTIILFLLLLLRNLHVIINYLLYGRLRQT